MGLLEQAKFPSNPAPAWLTGAHLIQLLGEHKPLQAQDGGEMLMVLGEGPQPPGQAVHRGLAQHPQEAQGIQHPLQNVALP